MFNPLKAYLLKRFYLYVLGQKSSRLGLNSIEISWIKKKKKQKRLNSTYIWHYGLTTCLNKNLNLIILCILIVFIYMLVLKIN
jgi:hypothetical protein